MSPPTALRRWLAYVAGAVLVLMHECGARVSGNLSILIHSAIPEGKGVSSSAAVEVATMSAVAAAMKIKLPGRQLAQLCQKVGVPPSPVWGVVLCHMATEAGYGGCNYRKSDKLFNRPAPGDHAADRSKTSASARRAG